MNIESRSLIDAITSPTPQLLSWLDVETLPASAMPPRTFDANADSRLIVPTARTTLLHSEPFSVRALVLSDASCSSTAGATAYVLATIRCFAAIITTCRGSIYCSSLLVIRLVTRISHSCVGSWPHDSSGPKMNSNTSNFNNSRTTDASSPGRHPMHLFSHRTSSGSCKQTW